MTAPAPRVYLDYNATAPVRPEVEDAVRPILFGTPDAGSFGNASSIHWAGREARRHLEGARRKVAALTERKPSEVIFTSGGSESDNLALRGVTAEREGARIIITAVEHPAILRTAEHLETKGVEVVRIGVGSNGQLDLLALDRALETPTTLVSVMAANNETGVVFPVDQVIERAQAAGARVHVDAVQTAGKFPLPKAADLITLSGHKLGGLKGVGALLTRSELPLEPLILGGTQERGYRAGTESVAGAVSLATALEVALGQTAESQRLLALRTHLEEHLSALDGVEIVGGDVERLPNTTTALFSGVEGESLLLALDLDGFALSSGSACSSGSIEPSHVLEAMGISPEQALSAVRFSTGWNTAEDDIERVVQALPRLLTQVRAR